MPETYDHQKVIDSIFDPIISEILSELEDGEKEISFLSEKKKLSELEIKNKLSYLVESGFVNQISTNGTLVYSVDGEKLSKIIENDQNFDGAIDGLTKMDSYLN